MKTTQPIDLTNPHPNPPPQGEGAKPAYGGNLTK